MSCAGQSWVLWYIGIGNGELRGEDDTEEGEGEGLDLDLVSLLERRGFELIGILGGLGSHILRFLSLVVSETKSEMATELSRVWDLFAASSAKLFALFHTSSMALRKAKLRIEGFDEIR
jgi:hypothetical protein